MRPRGPVAVLEKRRTLAFALLDQGHSLREAARRTGCAASSVMRWRDDRRRLGLEAVRVRFSPGRPRKISADQARVLVRHLMRGPDIGGQAADARSTSKIGNFILQHFRIRYHPDHVGRLMHGLGWTYEKHRPLPRAVREIGEKQSPQGTGSHVPNLEAGWVPGPSALRTWPFRKPR
jgi:transposase